MDKEKQLRKELYDKLERELSSYKKELESLNAKEIIDKSYETVIKEEVIYLFYPESQKFDLYEIKALKREKNSLETLYQGWMDGDLNICELVEDSVSDTLDELATELAEKQASKTNKNIKVR